MARFGTEGLDHVAIGVADVDRSREFYERVLGFERLHSDWSVPLVMGVDGTGVAIFDRAIHPSSTSDEIEPPAVRILHIAFRVGQEGFVQARRELAAEGIDPRFSDHGISHSLYIRDPDGHQIELTTYEV
ncbi:MAG: VOC family protein [Solirubrobacterales bacterium]|nr:VOC family protein [Solirubrobacterales bacterium]